MIAQSTLEFQIQKVRTSAYYFALVNWKAFFFICWNWIKIKLLELATKKEAQRKYHYLWSLRYFFSRFLSQTFCLFDSIYSLNSFDIYYIFRLHGSNITGFINHKQMLTAHPFFKGIKITTYKQLLSVCVCVKERISI